MSSFSTGQHLLGHALFWSLLAITSCSSTEKTVADSGVGGGGAGGTGGSATIDGGSGGGGRGGTAGEAQGGTTSQPIKCGDGVMDVGEACDDKNELSEDGCAADCKSVEADYICPNPGEACVLVQTCGDKKITGSENCDDGNDTAGDGCSNTCHVENGALCPSVGMPCLAVACGDGIVAAQETCDDGNTTDGDGCSSTCLLEVPSAEKRYGWICPIPGEECETTVCGNGLVEGSEPCDDGNNDMGGVNDSCSPFCRKTPLCPQNGGPCSTSCGDGILLLTDKALGQECDDGNTVSGDGCSAECKIEEGFDCEDTDLVKDTLTLPLIIRDFKGVNESGGHPDFEAYLSDTLEPNVVQGSLAQDGKPQHVLENKASTTNSYVGGKAVGTDWFSMWYHDAQPYNKTILQMLPLTKKGSVFQFTSNQFFPIDGLGWGLTRDWSHNFHFTSEIHYWFEYQGNESLEFVGDDDLWVFVNRKLAVDLGGVHPAISGSILLHASNGTGRVCEDAPLNCTTPTHDSLALGLELHRVYEIAVFHAERHTFESNYTLTLGNFNATESVCTSTCGDGVMASNEACDLGTAKNTGAYGTCNANCTLPAYCGDNHLDSEYEECDQGVNVANYGYNHQAACGPDCKWTHYCGDGIVDTLYGEQCDGNSNDGVTQCEENCTYRTGCGNGTIEAGEQCDDGNQASFDGCSEFCTIETILL